MPFFEGDFDHPRETESIRNLDLDGVLKRMREVTAEWKKGEDRDERVRYIELDLAKRLVEMEDLLFQRKEEVLAVIEEFAGLADDTKGFKILADIVQRLAPERAERFRKLISGRKAGVLEEEAERLKEEFKEENVAKA